ncbi:MAG TPA: hypothetical protein DEQ34_12960 [Balneolaceae bacterium]|nr:hypothetical protein [Balneolaceae bacterium]
MHTKFPKYVLRLELKIEKLNTGFPGGELFVLVLQYINEIFPLKRENRTGCYKLKTHHSELTTKIIHITVDNTNYSP